MVESRVMMTMAADLAKRWLTYMDTKLHQRLAKFIFTHRILLPDVPSLYQCFWSVDIWFNENPTLDEDQS